MKMTRPKRGGKADYQPDQDRIHPCATTRRKTSPESARRAPCAHQSRRCVVRPCKRPRRRCRRREQHDTANAPSKLMVRRRWPSDCNEASNVLGSRMGMAGINFVNRAANDFRGCVRALRSAQEAIEERKHCVATTADRTRIFVLVQLPERVSPTTPTTSAARPVLSVPKKDLIGPIGSSFGKNFFAVDLLISATRGDRIARAHRSRAPQEAECCRRSEDSREKYSA